MKLLKRIILATVWPIVMVVAVVAAAMQVPAVQRGVAGVVADALAGKLGTRVEVGRVDVGMLNRLVVDGLVVMDKQGDTLLSASRAAAKVSPWPLLRDGSVRVSSAQLFGLKLRLRRQQADAEGNWQFVLDSLASRDTTRQGPLDVAVNTLVVRRGMASYDQMDVAPTPGRLNAAHLRLTDLSIQVALDALTRDTLSADLHRLSFKEQSGLVLKRLSFALTAGPRRAELSQFALQLPRSEMVIPRITATYRRQDGQLLMPSLQYEGELERLHVQPADLQMVLPELARLPMAVDMSARLSGTSTTINIAKLDMSTSGGSHLLATGDITGIEGLQKWFARVADLRVSEADAAAVAEAFSLPDGTRALILRALPATLKGEVGGDGGVNSLAARLNMGTAIGLLKLAVGKNDDRWTGLVETQGEAFMLGELLDDKRLGQLQGRIQATATLPKQGQKWLQAEASLPMAEAMGYRYHNIHLDGTLDHGTWKALLDLKDDHASGQIEASYTPQGALSRIKAALHISHLVPSALGLTTRHQGRAYALAAKASLTGNDIDNLQGTVDVEHLRLSNPDASLGDLHLSAEGHSGNRRIRLDGTIGSAELTGAYRLSTLPQTLAAIVASRVPTMPGLPSTVRPAGNNFALSLHLRQASWLEALLDVPLQLREPVDVSAQMNDGTLQASLQLTAPDFSYAGTAYSSAALEIHSPSDSLVARAKVVRPGQRGEADGLSIVLHAGAANNQLATLIDAVQHGGKTPYAGKIDAKTRFFTAPDGKQAAHMAIAPSTIAAGDSTWTIEPANLYYSSGHLSVDRFALTHHRQHLIVSGDASAHASDSLTVDLQEMDVAYLLDLVNFHSVDFAGKATGRANIAAAFGQQRLGGSLRVDDFTFETGRMGTLHAQANYDVDQKQININAHVDDGPGRLTFVKGFVSPARNEIDLGITAKGTPLGFIEGFCGTFMNEVDATGVGHARLFGPLSAINLEGEVKATGSLRLRPTNTSYTFKDIPVVAKPNHVLFPSDTLTDRFGHVGVLTGELRHTNLARLQFDLSVDARNLLSYETHTFGDDTFYGTVFATGKCDIHGRPGEVVLDIEARPEPGTIFVYNASQPDAITGSDFITWHDTTPHLHDSTADETREAQKDDDDDGVTGDVRANFLIDANQNLTLRLLMDAASGDYIDLIGDGALRASWFNKGSFDLFGNYLVNHGIYKLTIQNVIKKDFTFEQGGTIVFGGDPYKANLNLTALYTVNGVSLSDLNLGRSFSQNNVRVNCMMNISGTPEEPSVEFSMDLPTVNADARQMVMNVMNGQEEMNEQVICLLTVGRFILPRDNNAASAADSPSQTSLAMQSLLSGTISQQLNNVLSSVVNNANWNFGANISTGNEGWSNAEYEGILSGRMLNNRLLFNGQFGYRDNAATNNTSFIGDFDLRYLLFPSGDLAVRVYNQTNDRYFTPTSLNTQGLGFIWKRDFSSLRDFFTRRRMPKVEADKKTKGKKKQKAGK